MRIRSLIFLLLSGWSHAFAGSDPERTVREFYSWALVEYNSGLPSERQLNALSGILAPDLIDLIKRVSNYQAQCAARFPENVKPPIVETSIFSPFYDNASEIIVGDVRLDGIRAVVSVELILINDRLPKAAEGRIFRETGNVMLRQADHGWIIGNFSFGEAPMVEWLSRFLQELKDCVSEL
jgi:hypothetical protein